MPMYVYPTHSWKGCISEKCEFHGQPRYQSVWMTDSSEPRSEQFIIDTYYVQVDYKLNFTKISTLDVVLLIGTITLPQAISFNLKNYDETLTKIKTIIIFS